MEAKDIVEMWRREADEQGFARGLEQGLKQGLEQGFEQGLACALIACYRARFGEIPEDMRAAMEDTHDPSILEAWVTRMSSVESAAEIDAEVRAVRSGGEPRVAAQ